MLDISNQGFTHLPKIKEPPQNPRRQEGDLGRFRTKGPRLLGAKVQTFIVGVT